jgi:hypothetical protein
MGLFRGSPEVPLAMIKALKYPEIGPVLWKLPLEEDKIGRRSGDFQRPAMSFLLRVAVEFDWS